MNWKFVDEQGQGNAPKNWRFVDEEPSALVNNPKQLDLNSFVNHISQNPEGMLHGLHPGLGLLSMIPHEGMSPLTAGLRGIERVGSKVSHGIAQPLLESLGYSEPLRKAEEYSKQKFAEAEEKSPIFSSLGEGIGEALKYAPIAELFGPMTGAKRAMDVGKQVQSLGSRFSKYLGDILKGGVKGGAAGAIGGSIPYGNLDERMQQMALEGAMSTIGGMLFPAATPAAKYLGNLPGRIKQAYPKGKVAEKTLSDMKNIQSGLTEGYEGIKSEVQQSGLNKAEIKGINKDELLHFADENQSSFINDFLENPTKDKIGKMKKVLDSIQQKSHETRESSILELPPDILKQYKSEENAAIKQARKALNQNMLSIPKKRYNAILKKGSSDEIKPFLKALKNPTYENLHDGQSNLAHLIRALRNKKDKTGTDRSAIKQAQTMRKVLREQINHDLIQGGRPDLAERYKELSNVRRDVLEPYLKSKLVYQLEHGEIPPEDFEKVAPRNRFFRAKLLEKYPEYATRQHVKHLGLGAGALAAGIPIVGGGLKAYEFLKGFQNE